MGVVSAGRMFTGTGAHVFQAQYPILWHSTAMAAMRPAAVKAAAVKAAAMKAAAMKAAAVKAAAMKAAAVKAAAVKAAEMVEIVIVEAAEVVEIVIVEPVMEAIAEEPKADAPIVGPIGIVVVPIGVVVPTGIGVLRHGHDATRRRR